MCNLGALFWYKDGHGLFLDPFTSTGLKNNLTRSIDTDRNRGTEEALSVWDEALMEALMEFDETASACGATSSIGVAGPGVNVRTVQDQLPRSETSSHLATSGNPPESLLDKRLKNPEFTAAYATILANMAEALQSLGRTQEASEKLSSALKAIEVTEKHVHHTDVHSVQGNKESQCIAYNHKIVYQQLCVPIVGRLLGLIAQNHLEAGQAVTAEGLFRSALDKLQTPFVIKDIIHCFQRALLLHQYGILQTKWDKREEAGTKMLNQASVLLKTLPVYSIKSYAAPSDAHEVSALKLKTLPFEFRFSQFFLIP